MMGRRPSALSAGFTLVELVIAVAILAILIGVAIPSYTTWVTNSNRAEGKALLMTTAQALERCFTRFSAYNSANCQVSFPLDSENGWYRISAPEGGELTATTFLLTAQPQNAQATRDTRCANLTLNHRGVRGISGTGTVGDCW